MAVHRRLPRARRPPVQNHQRSSGREPAHRLKTNPPFSEYHLIDADPKRAEQLRTIAGDREDVHIYSADCNDILKQWGGVHEKKMGRELEGRTWDQMPEPSELENR